LRIELKKKLNKNKNKVLILKGFAGHGCCYETDGMEGAWYDVEGFVTDEKFSIFLRGWHGDRPARYLLLLSILHFDVL
jgi:hypothetical protein